MQYGINLTVEELGKDYKSRGCIVLTEKVQVALQGVGAMLMPLEVPMAHQGSVSKRLDLLDLEPTIPKTDQK